MSQQKQIAVVLVLLGLVVVIVSFAADAIGLGAEPGVIGWKQQLGALVGLLLAGLGIWRWRLRPSDSRSE